VIGSARSLPGDWGWLDERLVDLVESGAAGVVAAVLAVLLAVAVGVVHAAGPGHGKVLVGSYLAGTSGRRRDAVALGVLIASMHTGSVLVLGTVYVLTRELPAGGRISQVLELLVALAVVAVGVVALRRARTAARRRRAGAADAAVPAVTDAGESTGTYDHPPHAAADASPSPAGEPVAEPAAVSVRTHDHHHALPEGVAPLSRSGVLTLAAAGGLVPSPAAFLILVTAVALDRPWFGLALLGGFSIGLALTLTVVGFLVLSGRDQLLAASQRRGWAARLAGVLPTVAAAGVLLAGTVMVVLAASRF
jgi:nickel/cobalt transporter (NicO) family protein